MFSCDSRDRAKPVGRKSYVSTPEGQLTTGNRANSSGVKSGSSTWTRVVIQRYTVEMLVGESVSTRQPGSVRDQFDTAKVSGTYPLSIAAPNEHITLLLSRFPWKSVCRGVVHVPNMRERGPSINLSKMYIYDAARRLLFYRAFGFSCGRPIPAVFKFKK